MVRVAVAFFLGILGGFLVGRSLVEPTPSSAVLSTPKPFVVVCRQPAPVRCVQNDDLVETVKETKNALQVCYGRVRELESSVHSLHQEKEDCVFDVVKYQQESDEWRARYNDIDTDPY